MENILFLNLKTFLQKENYPVNEEELELQLLSHPAYPSMYAVTEVLSHFGIDNLALEVPKNRETLSQLPEMFLAHVKTSDQEELILVKRQNHFIKKINGKRKQEDINVDDFLEMWLGYVVVIEKAISGKIPGEKKNIRFHQKLFLTTMAVSGTALFFYLLPGLFQGLHYLLSLIGLVLSVLIIQHESGTGSDMINRFCTRSEKTSCDTVLSSKGAILLGSLKLSDLSIVYFTGLTISWLPFAISGVVNYTSSLMVSIMTPPVIFYTVYYQWKVVKRWCPLCLSIALVLMLQIVTVVFKYFTANQLIIDVEAGVLFLFSVLLALSAWLFVKPLLQDKQAYKELQLKHFRFKRNYDLFKSAFHQKPSIPTAIESQKEIVLGNPDALLHLVALTNPLCYFCKGAHITLARLLEKYGDQVKITIRFNVASNGVNHQIANRLMNLYHAHDKHSFIQAMDEVYSEGISRKQWLKQWSVTTEKSYGITLEQQRNWCLQNRVHFTPALMVNGRLFPQAYEMDDLLYFIEDLIEDTKQIKYAAAEVSA